MGRNKSSFIKFQKCRKQWWNFHIKQFPSNVPFHQCIVSLAQYQIVNHFFFARRNYQKRVICKLIQTFPWTEAVILWKKAGGWAAQQRRLLGSTRCTSSSLSNVDWEGWCPLPLYTYLRGGKWPLPYSPWSVRPPQRPTEGQRWTHEYPGWTW